MKNNKDEQSVDSKIPDTKSSLELDSVKRYWDRVTEKTAKNIEPYEKARALSLGEAGQHVCR